REAVRAGQLNFGENRVQEGLTKIDELLSTATIEWHLIGHLQTNKAKKAAVAFQWIHSVDSIELLQKLDAAAAEGNARPRILIQVDLAHEATKSGAQLSEVPALIAAARSARSLELAGLMIVPPIVDNPEDARPWFQKLRGVR